MIEGRGERGVRLVTRLDEARARRQRGWPRRPGRPARRGCRRTCRRRVRRALARAGARRRSRASETALPRTRRLSLLHPAERRLDEARGCPIAAGEPPTGRHRSPRRRRACRGLRRCVGLPRRRPPHSRLMGGFPSRAQASRSIADGWAGPRSSRRLPAPGGGSEGARAAQQSSRRRFAPKSIRSHRTL